ncbi:MAG TPA: hypothetical protein VHU13_07500 [Solirubrobacteraceae bacterium]|jgi:hypothetical protein|nr:hypothetical protein [Solirubrobacteraceae bacterium]
MIGGSQGSVVLVVGVSRFLAPSGQSVSSASASGNEAAMPVAKTASNLRVGLTGTTVPLTGSFTLTLLVNGSVSALTCTVPAGSGTCSDTTDTVALAAGAEIAFEVVESGVALTAPVAFGWTAS